ncbi:hypothetical protein COX59_00490 [Candidatus Beckwithbacteria bacterium CG_4_10_14_0_2_um_filter_47_25]|uniref:Aminoglycoside phosphotransferase domain-containing protein n=5 Tax=Candidatus Beckwithiibacteriota TaxID=1752726 RepID=A0A1J4RTD2_9BACT|nr:MAG: hypothetical protein AUJ59_02150 [Candidatus Beckwithbacteria bacterium CG1_02_47_37]PIP52649.1 MAG: hypothetical protein COX09_00375 [Candidatus Beckwithbacteria bacterium CG23_combo_of_CG06-09_8_20_14_all_47_9]PJA23325.1 MAG: hypothetical protein COX59_00490 [Candidatus Beckwithbacteria bacterium CG_4_10_14_0_2_um_filter_47_25]PJC66133.1 MAG: hypothetical protein CO018_03650 [Candidatus Beckwithbacteria bacterium CG_4_9_14_0_2_um_filter_47_11]
MQKKKNDYDEYLANLHSKQITSEEVIKSVVKEGTGKNVISKKKIIAGEINEVYEINLEDKTQVVLRISRNGPPDFQQEKWAAGQCKKVGVPVPEIILIKYLRVENQELAFCLMEKIDGEPLERGKIDFDKLPLEQRKNYINQAGEILSKIHSISAEGFGGIIGDGKPQFETSDELILDMLSKREEYEKTAREENLDIKLIPKAMKIIQNFKEVYKKKKPCLNHGDYGHKHFMVKNGKIVGILDFGSIRSDTPEYDFSCFDYWFGHYIPIKWLKEGYQNKSLFNAGFEDFLYFIRISKGLEIFEWYHKQGYKEAMENAKIKLIRDLNYFE